MECFNHVLFQIQIINNRVAFAVICVILQWPCPLFDYLLQLVNILYYLLYDNNFIPGGQRQKFVTSVPSVPNGTSLVFE